MGTTPGIGSGASRYRELNIMNRVLNKGSASESYLNSALISFSDVFHPASCMQSCHARDPKDCIRPLLECFLSPAYHLCIPRRGIEEEE
jgi:hypothetical protein